MSKPTSALAALTVLSACLILAPSCKSSSSGNALPQGKTVYARVCLHAEWDQDHYKSYSTNFVGTPDVFPPGHAFQVLSNDDSPLDLADSKTGKRLSIEFVPKHNQMNFETWFAETFSESKPSLPSSLSPAERKAVERCKAEVGMSRAALFLAWGYPPASLTPSRNGESLIYQWKRFDKMEVRLDSKGRVDRIID